jgi:hypothetical protein
VAVPKTPITISGKMRSRSELSWVYDVISVRVVEFEQFRDGIENLRLGEILSIIPNLQKMFDEKLRAIPSLKESAKLPKNSSQLSVNRRDQTQILEAFMDLTFFSEKAL